MVLTVAVEIETPLALKASGITVNKRANVSIIVVEESVKQKKRTFCGIQPGYRSETETKERIKQDHTDHHRVCY